MAPCINAGPFVDALASIKIGSAASLPSGVISTRNVTLTLSEGAIESGSFEHVLRWRRNSVMRPDAISAVFDAGASKSSDLASGEGGRSGGRPSSTWYLMERSGPGDLWAAKGDFDGGGAAHLPV